MGLFPHFELPKIFHACLSRLSLIAYCLSLFYPALPTLILRKRAGAAPWPVPITCCGWPLPQFGVPHKVHSSREQTASIEFQNSVVMPEYEGFLIMRPSLPLLISHAISQPN